MADVGLPESLVRFIADHFTAIEQLEVLLLLRNTPEREWNAADVTRELRSSGMSIRNRLAGLAARGFLARRQEEHELLYSYAPGSDEMRLLVDELAKAYKERRITVINIIYGKPASDLQSFAEAFEIIKRKGGR